MQRVATWALLLLPVLAGATACVAPDPAATARYETWGGSSPVPRDARPAVAAADGLPVTRIEPGNGCLPRGVANGTPPAYPRMSRRLGEEGWVELAFDVRQNGEVVGFAMASSSGSARLEAAALEAARTWRFSPRTGAFGVERLLCRVVFRLTRA